MKFLIFKVITLLLAYAVSSVPITSENSDDLKELRHWTDDKGLISNVAFSPDGRLLAIVDVAENMGNSFINNGHVIFLDVETLKNVDLTDKPVLATSIAFSPDGTLFTTGSEAGEITVYNFETFAPIMNVQAEDGEILDIAIDPNNQWVAATFGLPATTMLGETVFKVYDIATSKELLSLPCGYIEDDKCYGPYGAAVTFDQSGQKVFLATTDRNIRVWDMNTAEQTILGSDYAMTAHDLIYTDDRLVFITQDGVRLLNHDRIDDSSVIAQSNDSNENAWSIAIHPSEPILAIGYGKYTSPGSRDSVLRLWNTESGSELLSVELSSEKDDFIADLTFSPDGTLLASGGTDGTVRLWGVPAE